MLTVLQAVKPNDGNALHNCTQMYTVCTTRSEGDFFLLWLTTRDIFTVAMLRLQFVLL
jgi:hypothetical protein